MSESGNNAVFLSYASQDAEVATRICEALRKVGVEVWFDQNELVGGDSWDQKIRGQIKSCALFVPLISANTQARLEGYFRIEWKLAAERTHAMAAARPFLLPVVVDATRDAEAHVPTEFRAVQWTKLPGGETSAAFVARVQKLLGGPSAPAGAPLGMLQSVAVTPAAKSGLPLWVSVTLGFAVVALAAVVAMYPNGKETAPVIKPVAESKPAAVRAPVANDKSIAVLPFVDMSPGKDQEYVSDGLAEELLDLLAKIPDLRVTSRSSAFSFKGKNVDIPEIARRLHVSHILEGSIRKSGDQLRITAQLIDARTDTHIWSRTFDRPLDDIFAVQREIAEAVAAQLQLALLGATSAVQKTDPRAYDFYLQATFTLQQGKVNRITEMIALLRQALAIDPSYVSAWGALAIVYTDYAVAGPSKGLSVEEKIRLAREAAEHALAIDPSNPQGHVALFGIALNFDKDLAAAAHHLEQALALDPNNPRLKRPASILLVALGRIEEAIGLRESLVAVDPLSSGALMDLGYAYHYAGRPDSAIGAFRNSLKLSPHRSTAHSYVAFELLALGNPQEALTEIELEPVKEEKDSLLPLVYHALGRKADSDAALAKIIREHGFGSEEDIAGILAYRGEVDGAFEWLEKAVHAHTQNNRNIAVDPMFANLHADPRWLTFLRRIGKAPEQLAAIKFDVRLLAK